MALGSTPAGAGGAAGPSPRVVAAAAVGWLGLAAALTLVWLAMRAVMGVGGSCASGGPYEVAVPCPDGVGAALSLGIPVGMAFAGLASWGGIRLGGFWATTPILAWSALFGSLGFNFLDAAWFSAPPEAGLDPAGILIGLMFEAMALVPLAGTLLALRAAAPSGGPGTASASRAGGPEVVRLAGPGQPARPGAAARPAVTVTTSSRVLDASDLDADLQARLAELRRGLEASADPGAARREQEALAGIAADFGQAIANAVAHAPVAPGAGGGPSGSADAEPEFTEGTQALLDRLERLADMRDRGLLEAAEDETAKAAIMAELEGRS